jgi:hypothetical protein
MRTSHELLLKLKYDPRYIFGEVEVFFVDRGAPGDMSHIGGQEIRALDSYYFEIETEQGVKYIPYHRLRRIRYSGETVWER